MTLIWTSLINQLIQIIRFTYPLYFLWHPVTFVSLCYSYKIIVFSCFCILFMKITIIMQKFISLVENSIITSEILANGC